jgi:hypothetical protein
MQPQRLGNLPVIFQITLDKEYGETMTVLEQITLGDKTHSAHCKGATSPARVTEFDEGEEGPADPPGTASIGRTTTGYVCP